MVEIGLHGVPAMQLDDVHLSEADERFVVVDDQQRRVARMHLDRQPRDARDLRALLVLLKK